MGEYRDVKKPANWMVWGGAALAACLFGACLVAGAAWGLRWYMDSRKAAATSPAAQATSTGQPIPSETARQPETPTPTSQIIAQAPPQTPAGPQASFEGVQLSYPALLAREVIAELAPAQANPDDPAFAMHPAHIVFTFSGYLLADTFHTPVIRVYPAEAFAALTPHVAEVIEKLKATLETKPLTPPAEGWPFLPIFNAAQLFHSNPAYLDFQNGSGLRYLAQYGQAAWPINSYDLFYTFQGLTHDRKYYISAILPVSHPSLPTAESVTLDDAFYNNFEQYSRDMEAALNALPDESFLPSLAMLDEMLRSLLVSR